MGDGADTGGGAPVNGIGKKEMDGRIGAGDANVKEKPHYRHCGHDPQSRIDRLKGENWIADQVCYDGRDLAVNLGWMIEQSSAEKKKNQRPTDFEQYGQSNKTASSVCRKNRTQVFDTLHGSSKTIPFGVAQLNHR